MSSASYVDLWVCQGRLCRSSGSDDLLSQIHRGLADRPGDAARVRVLRGGCYGICEGAPNLVVRCWPAREARPDAAVDRLILTEQDNERVYGRVGGEQVPVILRFHLEDAPEPGAARTSLAPHLPRMSQPEPTRAVPLPPPVVSPAPPQPQPQPQPQRSVAERIQALRRERRARAAGRQARS